MEDCKKIMLDEFAELNDKIIDLRNNLNDKNFINKIGFNRTNLFSVKLKAMQIYAFTLLQIMELEGFTSNDKCELYYNGELVYSEEK